MEFDRTKQTLEAIRPFQCGSVNVEKARLLDDAEVGALSDDSVAMLVDAMGVAKVVKRVGRGAENGSGAGGSGGGS